jgi:hypothetical protein
MRALGVPRRGLRRRPGLPWALVLAASLALVALRLLALVFALFQHAYLDSLWFVPGARVAGLYWASVRFAFEATVLVSVGLGLALALVAVEVGRALGR